MMHTLSGHYVNPLSMHPHHIEIKDIAHALSLVNRFAGHTRFPVSVAMHSINVARLVLGDGKTKRDWELALQGLLHDASEAYLGDVTKWVKQSPQFARYRHAEEDLQRKIYTKYGCTVKMFPEVAHADKLAVRVEAYKSIGPDHPLFLMPEYPLPSLKELKMMHVSSASSWKGIRGQFLDLFDSLVLARKTGCFRFIAKPL